MRRLALILASVALVVVACSGNGATSEDETAPPPPGTGPDECRMLSAAEVAAAIGVAVDQTSADAAGCTFEAPGDGAFVSVAAVEAERDAFAIARAAAVEAFGADSVEEFDAEFEGYVILARPGQYGSVAWSDGVMVTVDVRGAAGDLGAAVMRLAGLAVARMR